MRPVKAIDLVWKAQPMIATLREIIKQNCDESKMGKFIDDCDTWLADAQALMLKKGGAE